MICSRCPFRLCSQSPPVSLHTRYFPTNKVFVATYPWPVDRARTVLVSPPLVLLFVVSYLFQRVAAYCPVLSIPPQSSTLLLPFFIFPIETSTIPFQLCFCRRVGIASTLCQSLAFLESRPSDRFTDYIDPRPRSHCNQPTCSSTGPPDLLASPLHSSPCLSNSRRTSNQEKHICTRCPTSPVFQRPLPQSRVEQRHTPTLVHIRMPYYS